MKSKNGVLYLALYEEDEQTVILERSRTAQIFLEMNGIESVEFVTDSADCTWEYRTGMEHILEQIEKKQISIDCIVVWGYMELIHEQRDYDALKRKLNRMGIELIPINHGEIEIECEYYFEP